MRARGMRRSAGVTVIVHASAVAALLWAASIHVTPSQIRVSSSTEPNPGIHMVFLHTPGPGGGGGGNRQPAPPSRAQAVGDDRITLPVARPVVVTPIPDASVSVPMIPSVVLQAIPA